jgi:hypothetical protein
MPSIQITYPVAGQQFTLQRDPMSFQVILPKVVVLVADPATDMRGDALVVRAFENPAASTTSPLTPGDPNANPTECTLNNVRVIGAPGTGGSYESFKVVAWARVNGVLCSSGPVFIQLKVT